MQEILLTGRAVETPGYAIDPVYYPAGEVGGDFFRILAAAGGGTLLVVGDVSGKGLKAAMLVSVIVGALLNRRSSEPAEVLSELNNAMYGQMAGGFVTCCAALLMPDGTVKIANAGHLLRGVMDDCFARDAPSRVCPLTMQSFERDTRARSSCWSLAAVAALVLHGVAGAFANRFSDPNPSVRFVRALIDAGNRRICGRISDGWVEIVEKEENVAGSCRILHSNAATWATPGAWGQSFA